MTIDEALAILKEAYYLYYVETENGEAKVEDDTESLEAIKVIEEYIRKQDEILSVLKNNARTVIPLMGPNGQRYYEAVHVIIHASDEKMPLIKKWLEEES